MSSSAGKRLDELMVKFDKNQTQVASVLGISQPAVSDRLKGKAPITWDDAKKLEKAYGWKADWLMEQAGEMFIRSKELEEPSVVYLESLSKDTTEEKINQRFINEVKLYIEKNKLLDREAASVLHISPSRWVQVKRGEKNMTSTMLAHAVLNMGIDANYVVAELNTKPAKVAALEHENERLKRENENQALLIESLKEKLNLQKKSA